MANPRILEQARIFIFENARLLERRRFEHIFQGGSKQAVINTLRAYQNEDGGFGNALEPDIRCPQSQPVPTEMALMIMDALAYWDRDMLTQIIEYLRTVTLSDGGLPTTLRAGSDYPHAPWWFTDSPIQPSVNPTGRIIGLLYKQRVRSDFFEDQWFTKTVDYLWRVLEHEQPEGYHDGIQWITFLQHTPERERAQNVLPLIEAWLRRSGTIETNPEAVGYVQKVLDWAPTPQSYANPFILPSDIQMHLDALVKQQQADGGWPINWPPMSTAVETEWRGLVTLERVSTLKAYGII